MKVGKRIKIGAAALGLFAVSTTITCFVLSGVNIYRVPVVNNIAAAFYESAAKTDIQKPVIIIDAGHGGMDGGASSADGVVEKDLTLSIAKTLEEEISQYDVTVIMTRTSDAGLYTDDDRTIRQKKREDLLRRKEIIEGADPAIAISIHLNSFPQDVSVCGAQVFYPKCQENRTTVRNGEHTSKEFAEAVQKSLENTISDGKERTAMAKNDILMFEDISAKVILVECGFLSNPNESDLLQTTEYQQLLSKAIWDGINEILCLEKPEKIQIIDSANMMG